MQRRSFFGVVFGGFLARWLPWRSIAGGAAPQAFYPGQLVHWRGAPQYSFGFTGFKPAQYHPMVAGFYRPGDTFEIIGPGGRGTGALRKVDIVDITK